MCASSPYSAACRRHRPPAESCLFARTKRWTASPARPPWPVSLGRAWATAPEPGARPGVRRPDLLRHRLPDHADAVRLIGAWAGGARSISGRSSPTPQSYSPRRACSSPCTFRTAPSCTRPLPWCRSHSSWPSRAPFWRRDGPFGTGRPGPKRALLGSSCGIGRVRRPHRGRIHTDGHARVE